MKLAYVSSPLRAATSEEMEMNRERAANYCKAILEYFNMETGERYTPVSPVLNFRYLDDHDPKQRQQALNMGLSLLEKCDLMVVAGGRVTEGMRDEIQIAARLGIPVKTFDVADELVQAAIEAAHPILDAEHVMYSVTDYTGRLIILKSDAMEACYRTPENQLVYCSHGSGARRAGGFGDTLFCDNITTGEYECWARGAAIGAADVDKLPDWARERWDEFQAQKSAEREAARKVACEAEWRDSGSGEQDHEQEGDQVFEGENGQDSEEGEEYEDDY